MRRRRLDAVRRPFAARGRGTIIAIIAMFAAFSALSVGLSIRETSRSHNRATVVEIVGRQLNLPVASILPDQAAAHFGMMAMFAGMGGAASSALTQQWLGWKPTQIGMIADISRPGYFQV